MNDANSITNNDDSLKRILDTTDAAVWTDEFCRLNPDADWGTMVIWFANAIEVGREAGRTSR